MSDLNNLFYSELEVKRWQAERENATARLELAHIQRNIHYLLSQHEPVASLTITREVLGKILAYVLNGRLEVFEEQSAIQKEKGK